MSDMIEWQHKLPKNINDYYSHKEEYDVLLQDEKAWNNIPNVNYTNVMLIPHECLVVFRGIIFDKERDEFYKKEFIIEKFPNEERVIKNEFRNFIYLDENEDVIDSSEEEGHRQHLLLIAPTNINPWVIEMEKSFFKDNHKNIPNAIPICEANIDKGTCVYTRTNAVFRYDKDAVVFFATFPGTFKTWQFNHIIDVMGFISFPPNYNENYIGKPNSFYKVNSDCKYDTMTACIPCIHVLEFKVPVHLNPLLSKNVSTNLDPNNIRRNVYVKRILYDSLKKVFLNDDLVTTYFICHLTSSAKIKLYANERSPTPPISLNIYGKELTYEYENNVTYVEKLVQYINQFIPVADYIKVLSNYLNNLELNKEWVTGCNPLKDLVLLTNRMQLIIDETFLQPDALNHNGVINYNHLLDIVKNHEQSFEYNGRHISRHFAPNVLVFSKEPSNIPCDYVIPFRPEANNDISIENIFDALENKMKEVSENATKSVLDDIRIYITQTQILSAEQPKRTVSKDFLDRFGPWSNNEKRNEENAKSIVRLAQQLCNIENRKYLTRNDWMKAYKLEKLRRDRLPEQKEEDEEEFTF